jgi:hypothetical protein
VFEDLVLRYTPSGCGKSSYTLEKNNSSGIDAVNGVGQYFWRLAYHHDVIVMTGKLSYH